MSAEQVKIYIRNSKKYGKILNIPSCITGEQLYRLASATQNLPSQSIRLIVAGQSLPADTTQVTLKEKAIVHLINLNEVNVDVIEVNVKTLNGRSNPIKIQTESNVTIRQFIDDKLYKAYGERSDVLLLVHIGRQLNLNRTFREQLIENNSELIVANIQQLKNRKTTQSAKELQASQPINVPIKDLEVPEEPKDIYPQPNFTINVPQEVNANINMDFIFDSKIRHTSSLQKCDLQPQEIIPEEEVVPKISQEAREAEEDQTEGQKNQQVEYAEEKNEELINLESAKAVTSTEEIYIGTEVQNNEAAEEEYKVGESEKVEENKVEENNKGEDDVVVTAEVEENREVTAEETPQVEDNAVVKEETEENAVVVTEVEENNVVETVKEEDDVVVTAQVEEAPLKVQQANVDERENVEGGSSEVKEEKSADYF